MDKDANGDNSSVRQLLEEPALGIDNGKEKIIIDEKKKVAPTSRHNSAMKISIDNKSIDNTQPSF